MGYVYILENPAMPGLIKIGFTTKTPKERADQLYKDGGKSKSGVPFPFEVAYELRCENPQKLESMVHSRLADHRVNKDREFFNCSTDDARQLIEELHKAPTWRRWTSHFLTHLQKKAIGRSL